MQSSLWTCCKSVDETVALRYLSETVRHSAGKPHREVQKWRRYERGSLNP